MQYFIIDGNNLLGKMNELKQIQKKDKQASREKLAFILDRYFINKKSKNTLHLDGFAGQPIRTNSLRIIYSDNITSDEKIKSQIESSKSRRNITVVTSDNNLAEFARVCTCTVISSENFIKILNASNSTDEEKQRIKDIDNPEEFKKLFGVD